VASGFGYEKEVKLHHDDETFTLHANFPKWRHLKYTGLSSSDHGKNVDKATPLCGCQDDCDCAEVGLALSGGEASRTMGAPATARTSGGLT